MEWIILAQIVITATRMSYDWYVHRNDEDEEIEVGDVPLAKDGGSIPMVIGRCRVKQPLVVWHDEPRAEVVRQKVTQTTAGGTVNTGTFGKDLAGAQYISNMDMAISIGASDTFMHSVIHAVFFGEGKRNFSGSGLNVDGAVERINHSTDSIFFGAPGDGGGVGAVRYVTAGGSVSYHSGRVYGYTGSFTQIENTIIRDLQVAQYGANTGGGALRGFMHVVFDDFGFGEFSKPRSISFEVSMNANNPTVNGRVDNSLDKGANPAAALYNLLLDEWRGLGIASSQIDGASFDTAADYLDATDKLAFSKVYYNDEEALKIIEDLLRHMDAVLYVSPVDQKIVLKLIREDYTVGALDVFGVSEIEAVEDYSTTTWEETFNEVRVEYISRELKYKKLTVIAQDMGSINSTGGRRSITKKHHAAKTAAEAQYLVARELKSLSIPLVTVTLTLNRTGIELYPGDVFKWTWPDYNITEMVLRVLATDHGTLEDGKIRLMCARDQFASSVAPFVAPTWADRLRPPNPMGPRGDSMALEEAPAWAANNYGSTGETAESLTTLMARLLNYGRAQLGTKYLTGTSGFTSQVAGMAPLVSGPTLDKDNISYMRDSINVPWTVYGEVASVYSAEEPNYDQITGIDVHNIDDITILGTATEAEIRAGVNMVKIGDEFVAYESFTDNGGGSYTLDGVWRGLMDTVPIGHLVGQSVWFLNQAATTSIGEIVYPGDSELTVRLVGNTSIAVEDGSNAANMPITMANRARRPLVPDGVWAYVDGYDAVVGDDLGEFVYDADPDDSRAVSHIPASGVDDVSSQTDLGDVYTNDIRMSWLRRNRLHRTITRSDDADHEVVQDDGVRYRIEGKLDTDTAWTILGDSDVSLTSAPVNPDKFGYVTSGMAGSGPGKIRVVPIRTIDVDTEDTSLNNREISIDYKSCRQLVLNRKLMPSWDLEQSVSGNVPGEEDGLYAEGIPVIGNDDYFARSWSTSYSGSPRNRFRTDGTGSVEFLEQGDGQGSVMTNSELATNASILYEAATQLIPMPYDVFSGHNQILIRGYSRNWGATGTPSLNIIARKLDSTYAKLSESTASSTSTATTWRSLETKAGVDTGTKYLSTVLQVTGNDVDPNQAVSNLDIRVAPSISNQLLANAGFNTLASWTQSGTWQAISGGSGGVDPLNAFDDTGWALAPLSAGTTSTLIQTVTMPTAFHAGDTVHFRWWSVNTFADDTSKAKIEILDGSAMTLASIESSAVAWTVLDSWRVRELYLEVPVDAVDIRITLTATMVTGPDCSVGFDDVDLRCYRNDVRSVPTFDFSAPTVQSLPCCAKEMREQSSTPLLSPYEIWNFQEPAGDCLGMVRNLALAGTVVSQGAPAYGIDIASDGSYDLTNVALELKTGATAVDGEAKSAANIDDAWTVYGTDDSYGGIIVFRGARTSVGGTILGKQGSGASEPYWNLAMTGTGTIVLTVFDGTSTNTRTLADNFATGAWHMVGYVVDRTLNQIRIYSDQAEVVAPNSIASRGSFDSSTNPFQIGSDFAANAAVQVRYFAHFRDEHAEAMDENSIAALWTHAQDPSGVLTVHTRASTALVPISGGVVCAFTGERTPQYPIGYHAGFTDTNKLGLFVEEGAVNYCPDSEEVASWTAFNATLTDNLAVSPEGMKTAGSILQTGTGGYGTFTTGTVVASTLYTLHVWLYSVAGHSVVLAIRNQADTANVAITTKAVPAGVWTKYTFPFITQAGQTAVPIRVYGGTAVTSTAEVYCTYVGVTLADQIEIHVPTSGGTATGAATVYSALGSGDDWALLDTSSSRTTFLCNNATYIGNRFLLFLEGSGNLCSVNSFISTTSKGTMLVYNDAGVLTHNLAVAGSIVTGVESVESMRWRSGDPLNGQTYHARIDVDGSAANGTGVWECDRQLTEVHVGSNSVGNQLLNGVLQKIEFWRGDRDDL